MNPKANFYFQKAPQWAEALELLRAFVLDCGLTEELKWGVPCYTFEGRNIVLLHVFKDYCAVLFFKGALLRDASGVLVQQTANTQAARQLRFATAQQVVEQEALLKAYLQEALELEKSGAKVAFKATADVALPAELASRLAESPALQTAFASLSPGRQRAYLLYFAAPKQAKTREARVEKYRQPILLGKGLHE